MRNLFILASSLLIITSCDPVESIPADNIVVISPDDYAQTVTDMTYPAISEISIEGNILTITYCASGCDGNTWISTLFDAGVVMESMPIQRNLVLNLENLEACLAIPCKTETYDLTPIHDDAYSSAILNFHSITGDPIQILYEY